MTTITREQLHERARRKVKELEFAITQSAFTSIRDGLEEELELARIALASLEENEFIPKNLDKALGVVGVALPESKEEFNFQTERWIQRLIDRVIRYADEFKEQSAPVVPETLPCSVEPILYVMQGDGFYFGECAATSEAVIDDLVDEWNAHKEPDVPLYKTVPLYAAPPAPVVPESISVRQAISALESADCVTTIGQAYKMGWNACRAAMLQGGQPVSNRDELQVIGWLRSDYNSDDKRDPNAPLFMLGSNDPSEAWGVKYIPLSGSSPVTTDGWISCSERMPDSKTGVLVAREFDRKGDWRMKWATYIPGHPDANDGWIIPGASWIPSHWMPLPEPPQEEK